MLKLNDNLTKIMSLFSSFNLTPTIFESTRITVNCSSCIDNIFVNCDFVHCSILDTYISDHTIFESERFTNNKHQYKRFFPKENKHL